MRNAIPLLVGLVAALGMQDAAKGAGARPAPQPADASAGEDELDFAVQLTAQSYRRELEILRSMQDAVSTANAAPSLRGAMQTRYKLFSMVFDFEEYCDRCDAVAREDALACARELQRLEEADFYGVVPVRELFVCEDPTMLAGVGETLRAADALPAEEADELAERLRVDMALYQQGNAWLVGGPGFSRESAWVVTVEDGAVERERHLLRSVFHSSPCGKSFHEVDGRVYDCLYMVYTVNGEPYRVEQWFDVTLCSCLSQPDPEELVAEDDEEVADDEEELVAEDPDED